MSLVNSKTQELQNLRNTQSKSIGKAKAAGEDIKPLLDAVANLGDELDHAKSELQEIQKKIDTIALSMPNIPHQSVPSGNSEDDNVEVSKWGAPGVYDFEVKDHVDLGEMQPIMLGEVPRQTMLCTNDALRRSQRELSAASSGESVLGERLTSFAARVF